MLTSFCEICGKEIINTLDGSSLGFAGDIVFDTESRKTAALIIKGKPKFFGIFGKEEDIYIGWEKIETIGKDTILVKTEQCSKINNEKINIFEKIFNIFLY